MSNATTTLPSIHPSSNNFRINAKSFFLTYPQCNATKEDLKTFLDTKGRTTYLLIGRETHEDGAYHLHALVTYERKLNVKRQNYFDFQEYHPNIQAARNLQAVKTYIQKEDTEPLIVSNQSEDDDDNLYDLARVTPEENFFELCRKRKVTIHPLIIGPIYVCQSGIPQDTARCKRKHHSRGIPAYWDDFINNSVKFAIAHGYDFSVGERTIRYVSINYRNRENNLGTDCIEQTCLIREASGYTARIQKWIPQVDNLRRYVVPTSATPSSNTSCGSIPCSADTRPLCSSQPSSQYSKNLFVQ